MYNISQENLVELITNDQIGSHDICHQLQHRWRNQQKPCEVLEELWNWLLFQGSIVYSEIKSRISLEYGIRYVVDDPFLLRWTIP